MLMMKDDGDDSSSINIIISNIHEGYTHVISYENR